MSEQNYGDSQEGGNYSGGGENQGGGGAHVSYIKHLGAGDPDPSTGQQGQGGSFIDKVPGGWWTIGIGGATLVVGIIALRYQAANAAAASSGATSPYIPQATNSMAGGSTDTTGQIPSALDSQLSNLFSQDQINYNILQGIANNMQLPVAPNGSTPTTNIVAPPPLGTAGYSKARWIYTTQVGDTLQSLTDKFGWGAQKQAGGGTSFLYGYGNNANIFASAGVTQQGFNNQGINAPLPTGLKINA